MLSAFMVWLQGRVLDGTEESAQRWEALVAEINAPPPERRSTPAGTAVNMIAARMTEAEEAEAFAAYAGMT